MISRLHPTFRRDFARLPRDIQQRARDAYRRFQADPAHPGLQFKRLNANVPLWSVRVTDSYRAVGMHNDNEIVWFFIGTHADYDRIACQAVVLGASATAINVPVVPRLTMPAQKARTMIGAQISD